MNTEYCWTSENEEGAGLDGSGTGDSYPDLDGSDLGLGDSAATPPAATGTPGAWTPADITDMVTAIGTIPDMITATGEATAAIIDAADNQRSAPDLGADDTDLLDDEPDLLDSSTTGTGDDSSDSTDTGEGEDDMTLEEYLNSQASNTKAMRAREAGGVGRVWWCGCGRRRGRRPMRRGWW